MKRNIYILFAISLLIRMLPLHSANSDTEHLSTLKRLIDSNIAYDSLAPMDSVIVWGQQISPILEKDNKMELSFSIRQLVVYLYSLRGDIGNAIDEAREMYEKAETIKYDFGMALSSAAIGDAYFCSNMPEEAIASYKEAIRHPAASPEKNDYSETYSDAHTERKDTGSRKIQENAFRIKIHTQQSNAAIPDTCYRCVLLYPKERITKRSQLPSTSRANLPVGQATLLQYYVQLYAGTI